MQQMRILKQKKDCILVYGGLLAFVEFIFLPKKNEVNMFNLLLHWVYVFLLA